MLKELRKEHHITYLTLDDGAGGIAALENASEYAHEVITIPHRTSAKFSARFYYELARNCVSKLPYFMQKYISDAMLAEVERLSESGNFDVVVCDFLMPAVNMPDRISIPTVLFQHNVEAMIWQRHFEVQKGMLKKAYLKQQWNKSVEFERETCKKFDRVIAVSREDADVLRREYGIESVDDVPTGVDAEFFSPAANAGRNEYELVFTGSMDWLPNEEGILWFVNEVLPLIREHLPAVTLNVVGRNPTQSLIDLGKHNSSIHVTGSVEDVRPFMDSASAYIVPIRIGGGTRMKIFEAMAMELPIVSTTVGAEGLEVSDGVELLVRDSPQDFADAVVRLLTKREWSTQMGRNAAEAVRKKFDWKQVAEKFSDICEQAIDRRSGRQQRRANEKLPNKSRTLYSGSGYSE